MNKYLEIIIILAVLSITLASIKLVHGRSLAEEARITGNNMLEQSYALVDKNNGQSLAELQSDVNNGMDGLKAGIKADL